MEIISAAVFDQFSKSSVHRLHFFAASRNSGSSLGILDLANHAAIDAPVSGVKSDFESRSY